MKIQTNVELATLASFQGLSSQSNLECDKFQLIFVTNQNLLMLNNRFRFPFIWPVTLIFHLVLLGPRTKDQKKVHLGSTLEYLGF